MRLKFLKSWFWISLLTLAYLIVALSLQGRDGFYENGDYKKYLVSIEQDQDFNIINQGVRAQNWLVTERGYSPAFHSEAATPFLLTGHLAEIISPGPKENVQYRLGFSFLNFLLLLGSIYFLHNLAKTLGLAHSGYDLLFFLSSTAYMYFNLFLTNVLEIISCFLLSALLSLTAERWQKKDFKSFFWLEGILIGFAALFKPFNILYALALGLLAFKHKTNRLKSLISLWIPILILFGCELLNRYLKYGSLQNPMFTGAMYLMSYDLSNFLNSFKNAYMSLNGMFAANLSYLLGFIGLIWLAAKHRSAYFSGAGTLLICTYLFSPMFFLGNIAEDHLPGRIFINLVPLLFLGYLEVLSKLQLWRKLILQLSYLTLNIYVVLSYIHIDFADTYSYPKKFLVSPEELLQNTPLLKSPVQWADAAALIFISIFSGLLVVIIQRQKNIKKILTSAMFVMLLAFVLMTWLNYDNGPANRRKLAERGFYKELSVAHGAEALVSDYILDAASTFLQTDNPNHSLIQSRMDQYFEKISSQIETSDPVVQNYLATHDLRLSFWVRENQIKMNLQK